VQKLTNLDPNKKSQMKHRLFKFSKKRIDPTEQNKSTFKNNSQIVSHIDGENEKIILTESTRNNFAMNKVKHQCQLSNETSTFKNSELDIKYQLFHQKSFNNSIKIKENTEKMFTAELSDAVLSQCSITLTESLEIRELIDDLINKVVIKHDENNFKRFNNSSDQILQSNKFESKYNDLKTDELRLLISNRFNFILDNHKKEQNDLNFDKKEKIILQINAADSINCNDLNTSKYIQNQIEIEMFKKIQSSFNLISADELENNKMTELNPKLTSHLLQKFYKNNEDKLNKIDRDQISLTDICTQKYRQLNLIDIYVTLLDYIFNFGWHCALWYLNSIKNKWKNRFLNGKYINWLTLSESVYRDFVFLFYR
jgi:hypothetical protein